MEGPNRRCLTVCSTVGLLFSLIGLLLALTSSTIFNLIVKTQLVLSPDSASFPMWVDLPLPIKTSMYLFNVSNAEDFSKNGAKPKLEEVGPYVFDEFHKKVDLIWNDSNGTVTYKQVRTFYWRPEKSSGHLWNDMVTVLNVPAATVGSTAKNMPKSGRGFLNFGIKLIGEKLFARKSAGEILFDGYKDPLLDAAEFIHKFNIPMPGLTDKFGLYYGRNGSDWWDGVFNMYTGAKGTDKLGQVATWNYSSSLDFFPGHCGDVEGAGDFFSPDVHNHAELYSNDLCRPIVLNFTNSGSVKGVPGDEYRILKTYFANSTEHPSNWCFERKNGSDLPSGVYNASACRFGAPIFMSQPHFYQADPYYIQQLSPGSMNPSTSSHETVFVIEPNSGIPLSVAARFQLNVLVDQVDGVDLFQQVPKRTVFPVAWFESEFDLADSLVGQMWILSHMKGGFLIGGLFMLSLGLASMSVSFIYLVVMKYQEEDVGDETRSILAASAEAAQEDPANENDDNQQLS